MSKLCMGCMEFYEESKELCPLCGYAKGTAAKESYHLSPGSMLQQRYIVGRVLGFGSFGITYIGYDNKLKRKVAIKEYLPGEFSTREPGKNNVTMYTGERREQFSSGRDTFLEEARKLGKFLSEPEVIHIFDTFEENMTAYIVMEYLEGESLKEKIDREGALPIETAESIIFQVLNGLSKVHASGLLHRDIAPDNIYITKDGKIKIFDFGAARYATTKRSRSLTVQVKSGYTPEEQYQTHGNQGPWTDVYAAAATFYKMLTNVTPQDSMERKNKDKLALPRKLGVQLKKSKENALMNALIIDADKRTSSAELFKEQLIAEHVTGVHQRKKRVDIGKWPVWVKILSLSGAAAAAIFLILLSTNTIRFDIKKWVNQEIPTGKIRIPNLINSTVKEAEERGADLGFTVNVQDKEYSDEIPIERILSQTVQGGSLADADSHIGIVISAGVEQTYVPDVMGVSKEDADTSLLDFGLKVEYKEGKSYMEPGTVFSQNLAPDTVLDTGSSIEIGISKGADWGDSAVDVEVPDLTGLILEEAGREAEKSHLYLRREKLVYHDSIPSGTVISQNPLAGSSLKQNNCVEVVLSGGKEKAFVPDTQYLTQSEAEQIMEEAGFTVQIDSEVNATVEIGKIVSQNIQANTRAEKESAVTLVVSASEPARVNTANPSGRNTNTQNRIQVPANNQGENPIPAQAPVQDQAPPQAPAEAPVQQAVPTANPDSAEPNSDDISDRLSQLGL